MPCYSPLVAYQCGNGEIVFAERQKYDVRKELQLPCGQCIGCRLERSRQWAMRCMHEASLYKENAFITLTYDDEHLPERGQLNYSDYQAFMRRLRKHYPERTIRFYMCGEYGPKLMRPHFHACLFNIDFDDKSQWGVMDSGSQLYKSNILSKIWGKGYCTTGDCTFESAAYIARYCMKKITGWNARYHYWREDEKGEYQLQPEFNKMSLKPGIGKGFLEKWEADIYPNDEVILRGGIKMKPPKYYNKIYAKTNEEKYEEIKQNREMKGREKYEDNTNERLKVKEICAKARIQNLKRGLYDQ